MNIQYTLNHNSSKILSEIRTLVCHKLIRCCKCVYPFYTTNL